MSGKTVTSIEESISGRKLNLRILKHSASNICYEYVVASEAESLKTFIVTVGFLVSASLLMVLSVNENFLKLFILCIFVVLITKYVLFELLWKVDKECLLIVTSVGLQITSTFKSGQQISQFIAWKNLNNIVINEAITMHRVLYYLAVIVEEADEVNSKRLIPLFQDTFPRLECLEKIYSSVQTDVLSWKAMHEPNLK